MQRIPVPVKRTPVADMTVTQARAFRERINRLLDDCDVYPRRRSDIDGVSLALYSRMAELHESICVLVELGRRRDGVVLARTLCEAQITYYWLTNRDVAERFNRYIKFGAQIRLLNATRIEEFYEFEEQPDNGLDAELTSEAATLFKNTTQWNEKKLGQMANEPDEHDDRVDKTKPGNNAQYRLFYFWYSLHAHPTAHAIQHFFPPERETFRTSRAPDPYVTFEEDTVLFLSTTWLFSIFVRINLALSLGLEEKIDTLWKDLSNYASSQA